MSEVYAAEFSEIPFALANNEMLRDRMLALIAAEPIPGKVTEGGSRVSRLRDILTRLTRGEVVVQDAIYEAERVLPADDSPHAGNNRVFASGWAERLIRTQLSRFYNQAVLETLLARGDTKVFVPNSSEEGAGSNCTRLLAGGTHDAQTLYERLVDSYSRGNWTKEVKIPDHPHCTHTVTPLT